LGKLNPEINLPEVTTVCAGWCLVNAVTVHVKYWEELLRFPDLPGLDLCDVTEL
jgi:hypothetical protein